MPTRAATSAAAIAISLTTCLLPLRLAAQDRDRQPEPAAPKHGTFTTDSFDSEALGGRAEYGVYLPEGYDDEAKSEQRYPLVIWLHGMFEDHRRFDARGGTAILDRLIDDGEVPELIFVTPNGGRSSFYVNGKAGAYEDMITEDLLQHLEQTYRIDADREHRALMGVSMGGYGALKIGLKRPRLFGVVAAHSAALLPRDPDQIDEVFPWLQRWGGGQRALASVFGNPLDKELWDEENVLLRAAELTPEKLDGLALYLDCGDRDSYGFAAPNTELHQMLEEHGVPHTWRLVEGGGHGWRTDYNQQALPHSLAFVAAAWAGKRGAGSLGEMLQPPAGKDAPESDRR